jgi:hypothetical protein
LHPQWRLRWQRLHRWLVLRLVLLLLDEGIRGSVLLIRKMMKGESDGRNGTAAAAEAVNLGPSCVGAERFHLVQRRRSVRRNRVERSELGKLFLNGASSASFFRAFI